MRHGSRVPHADNADVDGPSSRATENRNGKNDVMYMLGVTVGHNNGTSVAAPRSHKTPQVPTIDTNQNLVAIRWQRDIIMPRASACSAKPNLTLGHFYYFFLQSCYCVKLMTPSEYYSIRMLGAATVRITATQIHSIWYSCVIISHTAAVTEPTLSPSHIVYTFMIRFLAIVSDHHHSCASLYTIH